jgi:outer membrane murein-binding lipoprotein Lpp
MKRLFAVVAIGLVAVATYALAAPAGRQAVTPVLLAKKVNKLSKTVSRLNRRLNQLESCLHADPVIRPGGAAQGYLYRNADSSVQTRTAIDFTDNGNRAYTWVLTTTSGCATVLNG